MKIPTGWRKEKAGWYVHDAIGAIYREYKYDNRWHVYLHSDGDTAIMDSSSNHATLAEAFEAAVTE